MQSFAWWQIGCRLLSCKFARCASPTLACYSARLSKLERQQVERIIGYHTATYPTCNLRDPTFKDRIATAILECGPMPNVMVALPNIGGALCSTPQSFADAHYLTAVQ